MDVNKTIINIKTGKPLNRSNKDYTKEEIENAKVTKDLSTEAFMNLLLNKFDEDTSDEANFAKIVATREDFRQYFFKTMNDIKSSNPKVEIDEELLPKETIGNVIMNAITNYLDEGKKETGFYINMIASSVLDAQEKPRPIYFRQKVNEVLEKALDLYCGRLVNKKVANPDGTVRDEEVGLGGYLPWVISQVKVEAGLVPEGIDSQAEVEVIYKTEEK